MVDALASGASIGNDVEVRVLSWAPLNPKFLLFNRRLLGRYYSVPRIFPTLVVIERYSWADGTLAHSNPDRLKGTRLKLTRAVEELLDGDAAFAQLHASQLANCAAYLNPFPRR